MAIIGLDIGGTNLKAVCATRGGEIIAKASLPAGGLVPREDLLAKLVDIAGRVSTDVTPESCGIAVGGKIQPDGTMLQGSTNLPNLAGLPLAETLSRILGLPCRIDNDARSAMRGEAWLGAARGLRNALAMTFGTGIGGGLLLDGRIHRGSHGGAGEIGVWRLGPEQPTLEEIAAPSQIAKHHAGGLARLIAERDKNAAAAQDAARIFDLLGRAIANAHLLLDLEAVILFGGVTSIGEPFRAEIENAFLRSCPEAFQHRLAIRLSTLGAYADAIGAAALWRNEDEA